MIIKLTFDKHSPTEESKKSNQAFDELNHSLPPVFETGYLEMLDLHRVELTFDRLNLGERYT